jgi:hypothetical protein
MTETKNEKFIRLSEARVGKAEFAMEQLHHLTSHNYEYSLSEAEAIISRLQISIASVQEVFGIETITRELPEPERLPEPEPEPTTGPVELSPKENLRMIQIGPQIGATINAIEDGKPEDAYGLLLNLMRS